MGSHIAATTAASLVVAGALAAHGDAQEEPGFEDGLERVRARIEDREWKQARDELDVLLDRHEGEASALLHRPLLVEWIEECAFWEGREAPRPEDVVSGRLVSYGRSGGTIRMTYTRDQLADFWVSGASEQGRSSGSRDTLDAERVYVHPAVFAGPYTIEIEGSRFPGYDGRLPVLMVGLEPGQSITATFGLPEVEAGRRLRWAEARLVHSHSGRDRVLDLERTGPCAAGESFRIKVEVQAGKVATSINGKSLLKGKKPRDLFGRFGFTGLADFDQLTIRGKVERAWIEGLVDEALQAQRTEFRKHFDVSAELPEWLQLGEPDWEFVPNPWSYPGPRSDERQAAFDEVMDCASKDQVMRGLEYVDQLDPTQHPEAFLEYLRAFLRYFGEDEEAALRSCETVCRLEPGFRPARMLRAELLRSLGRRTAARAALGELITTRGLQRWAYPRLTMEELLAGNQQEAGRLVLEAIEARRFGPELDEVNAWRTKAIQGPRFDDPAEHSSKHFRVVSGINRRTCIEAAEILESAFERFAGGLPAKPDLKDHKFQVYVFPGQASYLAYTGDVLFRPAESSAGLYSPMLKQLLVWNLPERERMLQTVRHEGLHQYLDLLIEDAPYWLNEGLAEYYEVADFTRTGDNQYPAHPEHARLLGKRTTRWADLEEFLYLGGARFMAEPELHYAQAWALVHYLRHGPRERRALFDDLFTLLVEGIARAEALHRTFDGVDLDALQHEVRRHLASLG